MWAGPGLLAASPASPGVSSLRHPRSTVLSPRASSGRVCLLFGDFEVGPANAINRDKITANNTHDIRIYVSARLSEIGQSSDSTPHGGLAGQLACRQPAFAEPP